jgi:hypothetical protein
VAVVRAGPVIGLFPPFLLLLGNRPFGVSSTLRHICAAACPGTIQYFRYAFGGSIFGVGWAFAGASPSPLFALLGSGIGVMAAAIVSALAGTWAYGALRERLPH